MAQKAMAPIFYGPGAGGGSALAWRLAVEDLFVTGADRVLCQDPERIQVVGGTAEDITYSVVSSSGGDTTQSVAVWGVNNAGSRVAESLLLTGKTAVNMSSKMRFLENVMVDGICTGAVQIKGNGLVAAEISVDEYASIALHKFVGKQTVSITNLSVDRSDVATITNADLVYVELRHYPEQAGCLAIDQDYVVADRLILHRPASSTVMVPTARAVYKPTLTFSQGYVAVVAWSANGAGVGLSAVLSGYDTFPANQ